MQKRKGNAGFKPPVEVGEELDVVIEAVGEKGDGIAKKNGFVLFIPNAKEGKTVRVKITKVLQKVGFAEVVGKAESQPVVHKKVEESVVKEVMKEPEQHFEDTEDFGDESEEVPENESSEKKPIEEEVSEEVVEEVPEDESSEEKKEADQD